MPVLIGPGNVYITAIGTSETGRRDTARVLGAETLRHFIQRKVTGGRQGQQTDLAVQHGEIKVGARAFFLPALKHGHDAQCDPQPGAEV
ncbi:hypothetical protein D3C73_650000 [compost metagenome]